MSIIDKRFQDGIQPAEDIGKFNIIGLCSPWTREWADHLKDIVEAIQDLFSQHNITLSFLWIPSHWKWQDNLNNIDGKIVEKVFQKVNAELNINQEEILVQTIYLDFGMKDENPVSRLRFYQKSTPNVASKMDKEETSRLLNGMQYNELRVRVYVKFSNETSDYTAKCEEVKRAFKETFQ
ncbi:SAM domain and HD [Bulinus truncatus]|nr:SAM domain and HD [Bulinus truncatus]